MEAAIRAIAAPRRREIMRLVWDSELPAGEIAHQFAVSWPAISQHLRVLKDAGLIEERRDGRNRLYSARKDALGSLRQVLEQEWGWRLGNLKSAAEAEARGQVDGR